jgi:2-methylisocitrate lyase-like PEP mutase family enzyme
LAGVIAEGAADMHDLFLTLHVRGAPLLLPNPWDAGSARLLAWAGFSALATTSSGFAATLGRPDGGVTADEALRHAAEIVAATPLPVSADLENGFHDDPAGVGELISAAVDTGLAGGSIEDFSGDPDEPIYPLDVAVARIAAAADAAHAGPRRLVLTARCENYLHGRPDLADTVARLQAFAAAGADVLYAPGITDPADIAVVVQATELPVNVLLMPGGPGIAELAALGVARISLGGTLAAASYGALVEAAAELQAGSSSVLDRAGAGRRAMQEAFRRP